MCDTLDEEPLRRGDTESFPAIVSTEDYLSEHRPDDIQLWLYVFRQHMDNPEFADLIAQYETELLLIASDGGMLEDTLEDLSIPSEDGPDDQEY